MSKKQEPEKIMEKVDQLFPKFSEQAADKLLRTLMMTGIEDVKKALYRSTTWRSMHCGAAG